jgi:hypothetical protein
LLGTQKAAPGASPIFRDLKKCLLTIHQNSIALLSVNGRREKKEIRITGAPHSM